MSDNLFKTCSRCSRTLPEALFRRRASYAEAKKYARSWVRTPHCADCAKPHRKKQPEELRKELSLQKKLPEIVVAHRVAVRRRVGRLQKVAKLRAHLRQQYAEATRECLAEVDAERDRTRANLANAKGANAQAAFATYVAKLGMLRIHLKSRATEGKAPPLRWWSELPEADARLLVELFQEARVLGELRRGLPRWWDDRDEVTDKVRARAAIARAQKESLAKHKAALAEATLAGDMDRVLTLTRERQEANAIARRRRRKV